MSHVDVARIIGATIARRVLFAARITWWLSLISVLLLLWLLASELSAWFWLLLIVIVPLYLMVGAVLFIAARAITRISPIQPTKEVKVAVKNFTGSLVQIAATRGISWPMFVKGILMDIVRNRELTALHELVNDAKNVRNDYQTLERLIK
ncbi:hypothetical protein KBD87_04415 [Candidatus Saccharibacteria bacterium]|jgi:ATP/ADP translocase|nr:hypothetical protein [Candidatus Saccharibacteria bacterium]